ncbi:excalibur calcium-binding domain-containing protein [Kribbella sp. CA-247076]|uniref:excalibur calcium-binding domain-containing protein n=1 Tax=Kribbella sp. CA-247076 TaxID=3239941 RepID=UPI003D8A042F
MKLVAGWVAGGIAFVTVLAAIGGSGSASSSPVPGATATATATSSATVTVPGPTATTLVTVPGPTETVTPPPLPARTVTIRPGAATVTVTERAPLTRSSPSSTAKKTTAPRTAVYYANCAAVRAAGKAPLYRGQPGYASHLDRDDDGVACE